MGYYLVADAVNRSRNAVPVRRGRCSAEANHLPMGAHAPMLDRERHRCEPGPCTDVGANRRADNEVGEHAERQQRELAGFPPPSLVVAGSVSLAVPAAMGAQRHRRGDRGVHTRMALPQTGRRIPGRHAAGGPELHPPRQTPAVENGGRFWVRSDLLEQVDAARLVRKTRSP